MELRPDEAFIAAVIAGNADEVRRTAARAPVALTVPGPVFAAINAHRLDMVELLLDLGTSPSIADDKGFSALHLTTHAGAPDIAR